MTAPDLVVTPPTPPRNARVAAWIAESYYLADKAARYLGHEDLRPGDLLESIWSDALDDIGGKLDLSYQAEGDQEELERGAAMALATLNMQGLALVESPEPDLGGRDPELGRLSSSIYREAEQQLLRIGHLLHKRNRAATGLALV